MKRLSAILLFTALGLAVATPARAALEYFLLLDDIDGTSTTRNYEKWVEVDTYQLGATRTTGSSTGTGGAQGKVAFSDFSFTKLLDIASPAILEALVTGKHLDTAVFDIVDTGDGGRPTKLFSYSFTDVVFTSVSHSGAEPGHPVESAAFTFGALKLQSYVQDPKGGSSKGPSFEYDLQAAAAVPEPTTWWTLAAGLVLLAGAVRTARPALRPLPA